MEVLQLKYPINNMKDLVPMIAHLYPDKKLTIPPLNKKRMMIANSSDKLAILLVQKDKGTRVVVKCETNMSNPGNIALMLLVLFGLIGIIILLIVFYAANQKKRKEKATEAYNLLKAELE